MKKLIPALTSLLMTLICLMQLTMPCFAAALPKSGEIATAESLYVDTDNDEADTIINNFIDQAIFLQNKSYYNNICGNCISEINVLFKSICGANVETWAKLLNENEMVQYLWVECYCMFCHWACKWCQAYKSWEARYAIAWGIDTFNDLEHTGMSNLLSRVGIKPDAPEDAETAALIEAYDAVLRYLYDYYVENDHYIYCFFTGQAYKIKQENDYSSYWTDRIADADTAVIENPSDNANEVSEPSADTVPADGQQTTAAPAQQSDKESHSNALIWALSGIALLAVGGFAAFQLKKRKAS